MSATSKRQENICNNEISPKIVKSTALKGNKKHILGSPLLEVIQGRFMSKLNARACVRAYVRACVRA